MGNKHFFHDLPRLDEIRGPGLITSTVIISGEGLFALVEDDDGQYLVRVRSSGPGFPMIWDVED